MVCPCGYEAFFPASLRRHQYGIHGGLIGHHTQLPRLRPLQASTDDRGSTSVGGNGDTCCGCAALWAVSGAGTTGEDADGNVADDESDVPPSSSPPSRLEAPASPPA